MEENYLNETLANWTKEFQRNDGGYYERTLRRRSKDQIIQSVLSEDENHSDNVRPWNYDDYLYRIRTYASSTWFAKPQLISPPYCARYGWINISCDTLKCESCNVEIVHDLVDFTGEEFAKKLISSHDPETCGWINNDENQATSRSYNFSPESFLYYPYQTLEARLSIFNSRFLSWYQVLLNKPIHIQIPKEITHWSSLNSILGHSFPQVSPTTSSSQESTEATNAPPNHPLRSYLTSLIHKQNTNSDPISDSAMFGAFFLSIYCWNISSSTTSSSSSSCSSCSICGRSFNLQISSTPPLINPSQEHKYYCPVVSSYTPIPLESKESVPSGYLQMIETLIMNTIDWKTAEVILKDNPDHLPISSFTVDSTKLKRSFGDIFTSSSSSSSSQSQSQSQFSNPSQLDVTQSPADSVVDTLDQKYKKIKGVLSMVPTRR